MENHPKPVRDYTIELSECIADMFDENLRREDFEKCASEKILEKFLAGEDLLLSVEEMEKILHHTSVLSILFGMKEKKLIDSVEDESGEEVFFLTDLGKKIKEEY